MDDEVTETSSEIINGAVDKAKNPQNLIDLLGASAKLLRQEVQGTPDGEQAFTDEVAGAAGTGEEDINAVLAKLKGEVVTNTHSGTGKDVSKTAAAENIDSEGSEAESALAGQETKGVNKEQANAQELLTKLKEGEIELSTKEKLAAQAALASDKKTLLGQGTSSENNNSQLALAGEQSSRLTDEILEGEPVVDELLGGQKPTEAKVMPGGLENGQKNGIQINKAQQPTANTISTKAIDISGELPSEEAAADVVSGLADKASTAGDASIKSSTGQSQPGHLTHERSAGSSADFNEQGKGRSGNNEQENNNAKQASGIDEISVAKEEISQTQQHKVASTPIRDQNTLAAQMNNSVLASADTPQAHDSEYVLDSVANKVSAENLQTQKNNVTSLNETLSFTRKDFVDSMKEKVMIMVNQKIQQVEIRLDPPELGNMHVRVNLQNEQAAVNFLVQSQQAKEALEQGMSKLKDMLSESGVDVGDANVEQQSQGSEDNEQSFGQNQQNGSGENGHFEQQDLVLQGSLARSTASGVDYYA